MIIFKLGIFCITNLIQLSGEDSRLSVADGGGAGEGRVVGGGGRLARHADHEGARRERLARVVERLACVYAWKIRSRVRR